MRCHCLGLTYSVSIRLGAVKWVVLYHNTNDLSLFLFMFWKTAANTIVDDLGVTPTENENVQIVFDSAIPSCLTQIMLFRGI